MARRSPIVALVAAAVVALGGCAGETLLPGVPVASSGDATSSSISTEAPGGSSAPKAAAFNPFSDGTQTEVGGRQVIANPTIEQVMLAGPLPEMALGSPNAPVTIIKYASLTCPYCRQFQLQTFPELKRTYIDTGKVRFILREFPIGFQSGAATVALRCAPPERYFDLYTKFMTQQNVWVSQEVRLDPIFKVASQVGMTREQFDACRQNQSMISGLQWVKERGRTLGVIGTPNFFVNGRLIKTQLGMKEIRDLVEPVLAGVPSASIPR